MNDLNRFDLSVISRRVITPSTVEFVFARPDGTELPGFTPGAHITVATPSGAMRRYSLINDGAAPDRYVIAVKREPNSRGGSASLHDDLTQGDTVTVLEPENEFELGYAESYLLIAGGIGITPILAMARKLQHDGADFKLIYCTRNAHDTAYLQEVKDQFGDHLTLHHDNGDLDQVYDFWDHFETPDHRHSYFCGPAPMKDELLAISGHWPDGSFHFEDFKPVELIRAEDKEFDVTIKATGQTINVPADRTILEAIRAAGVPTVSSCESGTCGTCKCSLVEGEADHRDLVLMDHEKKDRIMICISRSANGGLVIDL